MILIADSGSTKTDWVLLDEKNSFRYKTVGYNPYFIDSENIYQSVSEKLSSQFDPSAVKKVYFYGAGCSESEKTAIVDKALTRCFVNANVLVGHDMLAAARALLGNQPGFAAILGTGSNTCMYDGRWVTRNIDSLGYLLGDEGSGSYIGRKILRDHMRGYLPEELEKSFRDQFKLSNSDIFDQLYNKPLPNRFLAGFCMFADGHKDHEYIRKIVYDSFSDFFKNLVCKYEGYEKHTFNCIGSVGFIFRDILKDVARSYGMETGKIIHTPIEDLVNYHLTYS
jgi:N-acetylglucosamine kinase-like BadF-type ATPase